MTRRGPRDDRAVWGTPWRFLGAQTGSAVAALAMTTALGAQVFDLTSSELALGLLGLVEFLPSLLLVLVSGTLADRVDRRRMAAVALFFEMIAAVGLAAYTATGPTSALPIFALVLLFGVARAFGAPAMRSMPADLCPPGRLPWLTVRYSGAWQVSAIVGPIVGGVLYGVEPAVPYVVVAVLFLLAAASILRVRYAPHVAAHPAPVAVAEPLDAIVPAELEDVALGAGAGTARARPNRLREALEGARFIRRQPVLLGAITLDLAAVLFGGALALLPAIAEDRLGVGAAGLGWLRAAVGIGAAVTTLGLAWRPVQRNIGRVLLVVVALFGLFTVVLGATTSFAVAFVALAILSGADSVSVYIRGTLVPLITPDAMRGRVLAFEMVLIGASNELGAFESGVTGQILGPAVAVVVGGVASVVVAFAWWFGFPALRKLDRFPLHAVGADGPPAVAPGDPDDPAAPAPG